MPGLPGGDPLESAETSLRTGRSPQRLTCPLRATKVLECGKGNEEPVGLAERLANWAAGVIGTRARIVARRALHAGEGPWLLQVDHAGRLVETVLRAPTSRIGAGGIACNAEALLVAADHDMPAPRLLGWDRTGDAAGVVASVETVLPGTSAWQAPTTQSRLRAAGRAIAGVHQVQLVKPSEHLPYRPRPIAVDDFADDRRQGRMETPSLLRDADDRLRAVEPPIGNQVFVHGDVWPGNIVWTGVRIGGLIDWKTAGVGNPGVDLGELRKQVAITFGAEAPAEVLRGYEEAWGSSASDVAYWDVVAALNTPTVLDNPTFTMRRDNFLRAAVAEL